MVKVDSIIFICFQIIPETSKPEKSSVFSFLKTLTVYDHLIALEWIFKTKISIKTLSVNRLP